MSLMCVPLTKFPKNWKETKKEALLKVARCFLWMSFVASKHITLNLFRLLLPPNSTPSHNKSSSSCLRQLSPYTVSVAKVLGKFFVFFFLRVTSYQSKFTRDTYTDGARSKLSDTMRWRDDKVMRRKNWDLLDDQVNGKVIKLSRR